MPAAFEVELRKAIDTNPGISPYYAKEVLRVLDGPDTLIKRMVLRRLERHAEAHIREETSVVGEVDWSQVDWSKYLGILLKILLAILPFIL